MTNLATRIWFRTCIILTSGILLFLLSHEPTIVIKEPGLALIVSFICFAIVTLAAASGLFILGILLPALCTSQITKTATISRAVTACIVVAIIVTAIILGVFIREFETPRFDELLVVFTFGTTAAILSILSLHQSFNQFNTSNN